jgi:hypothetical protein
MKHTIISLSLCFCFFQAIGQNKTSTTPTTKVTPTTVNQLLQGKWQSMDDKTNYLVFEKNLRKEIGDGMKTWDVEPYALSNKCVNESDVDTEMELVKDKYISCKESDMCWYIDAVTKDFLTLIYMGRGNSLRYKRVK